MAPHRTRPAPPSAALRAATVRPALAAILAALVALGGCSSDDAVDGGISGTGIGDELGTAPAPESGLDQAVGSQDSQDNDAPEAVVFDNTLPARVPLAPLLRTANLSSRPVSVSVDGTASDSTLEPGGIAPVLVLSTSGRFDVVVSDAGTGAALGRLDAGLAPQTLTTLVVRDGTDGADGADGAEADPAVVPLETLATAPDAGTARVRVVYAIEPDEAAARVATLSLVPTGTSPGAAEVRFAVPDAPERSIASDYEIVGPGDYALTADGGEAAVPLTLTGGEVVTLLLGDADATGLPGSLLIVPDGDVP